MSYVREQQPAPRLGGMIVFSGADISGTSTEKKNSYLASNMTQLLTLFSSIRMELLAGFNAFLLCSSSVFLFFLYTFVNNNI